MPRNGALPAPQARTARAAPTASPTRSGCPTDQGRRRRGRPPWPGVVIVHGAGSRKENHADFAAPRARRAAGRRSPSTSAATATPRTRCRRGAVDDVAGDGRGCSRPRDGVDAGRVARPRARASAASSPSTPRRCSRGDRRRDRDLPGGRGPPGSRRPRAAASRCASATRVRPRGLARRAGRRRGGRANRGRSR